MTGKFLGCINDGEANGEITPELAAGARDAYADAFAAASQTLSPEDADRTAGKAVLTALDKAKIEAQRRRAMMIRTRRNLLEGIAGLKARRGYENVQALGGTGGKPPKGGWIQGGEPPKGGPFRKGAVAARALPLLMRNKGGLSGGPFLGVEDRSIAIRGLFDAKMAAVMEKFGTRLGFDAPNRASLINVVREAFGEDSGDAASKALAQAWSETAEQARQMFNAAGGTIGKLEHWGLPQAHDSHAIYRAGKASWVEQTLPMLDAGKMVDKLTDAPFAPKRLGVVLGEVYDRIVTHGLIDKQPAEHPGKGALALTRAEERFLVFKDADSWSRYQSQFGVADAFAAMVGHLDEMAKDIALMQTLGPNPEHQWGWLKAFAEREAAIERLGGNETAVSTARKSIARAQDMYEGFTGKSNVPVDEKLARFGATVRSYLNGADLGGAILTDMPSAPVFGALARSFTGIKIEGDMAQLARLLLDPRVRADARRMGFINEVARDGLVTSTQDSLRLMTVGEKAVDGMNVFARKLPSSVMRMQGLSGAFEARKRSFRLSFMAALHDASDKSLAQLAAGEAQDRTLAGELNARGFTDADWDAIRAVPPWEPRPGVKFLRPQDIAAHASEELALRVGGMAVNAEQFAVPVSGSLWTRAALVGGARPGTIKGELMRSLIMFRTFLVNAHYLYGEEVFLRGVQQGFNGARLGAHMTGWAAGMFGMLTMAGALSLQLKQLARGRDPLPMNTPQFWGAAMLQGGGLGIFGDFFFSHHARNDKSAPIVAAGPTGQLISDVWDATGGEAQDIIGRRDHPNRRDHEVSRLAHDMAAYTPGASLWWARAAFDRAVVDQLQMMIDPDAKQAFSRRARQIDRESGSGAWWPQGSAAPTRAPNLAAAAGQQP